LSSRYLWVFLFAAAGLRAQCALDRAVQLHRSGDLAGALVEYRACVAAEPWRVEARSNLGAVLAKLGRYQEAIDQYNEALKTASPAIAPHLRFNLALAYYKSAQIPQAVSLLEPLAREEPADLNLALLLGDCDLRTGDFDKAVALLTPFEASQADQPALDYALGMALIRGGHVQQGQLRVDRILRRGDSAEGHFLLGSSLFMDRDYPGAAKEFAKAASVNPDLPSLQSYYGQALLFTGDPDAAADAFRKELAADPNDYDANFQLASILAHRGRADEARPLLERAARLRPGSAEARDALAHGFRFEPAPESGPGVAAGSPAPAIGGLDLARLSRPLVLVFGSYTCPKLRGSAEDLISLYSKYGSRVDFRLVYIREAHAVASEGQWQSSINSREGVALEPPRDLAAKQSYANLCERKLGFTFPVLVDGMDAPAETAYAAWPSRVYLVGMDGRIAFSSYLGELDFRPADLDAAIERTLSSTHANSR